MRHTIGSEIIEAYSLCPRKAFLLMTGAIASPGPHEYEVVNREQEEANRLAHRARLADEGEVVSCGGPAEMAAISAVTATGLQKARSILPPSSTAMWRPTPAAIADFSASASTIGTKAGQSIRSSSKAPTSSRFWSMSRATVAGGPTASRWRRGWAFDRIDPVADTLVRLRSREPLDV